MVEKMNYQTFEEALGDWGEKLKPFIESKGMWDIYQKIKEDAKVEKIAPKSSDTFRAFKSCRYADLKVIFYLQDPYPRMYKSGDYQATGIAMDCRNTPDGKKLQPSLDLWYDAIDRYLEKNREDKDGVERMDNPSKCFRSPNLDYLHEQGVMMLNTDLTCKLNKTGSHEGLWEPFQKYLLENVMYNSTGIIYVLCGKSSHVMEQYINPLGNYIFKLEHPMAANHRGDEIWRDDDIFSKINKIITDNNGKQYKIWWDKADWDFYKDPPF